MSKEHGQEMPSEPTQPLPEPSAEELFEFRDDAPYRAYLDAVHLENSALLLCADLMADHTLSKHFGKGLRDRALHLARWLDMTRGKTSDTGRIDEDGEEEHFPATHEYSVYQKRAYVEVGMLTLIGCLVRNPEVVRMLQLPYRARLLQRIGHLRNAILISQREAQGWYRLVLRDLAGQPTHMPWGN